MLLTNWKLAALAAVTSTTLVACATSGTAPGDMTVAGHQRAAATEARSAADYSKQATIPGRSSRADAFAARDHAARAEAHRDAATVLRTAADQACVAAETGASVPLAGLRIDAVRPLLEEKAGPGPRQTRGYYPARLRGALVTAILSNPGELAVVTKALECERARGQAYGDQLGYEASPLAVRGASVTTIGEGRFALVEIRARNEDDATEVYERAKGLLSGRRP